MSTHQIFLIDEVIALLSDSSISLEKPLWKLFVFSKHIKNKELEDFLHAELNGYKGDIETPDFRKISADLELDLQLGYNYRSMPFPISILPSPWNKVFETIHIRDGIAAIEALLSFETDKPKSQFIFQQIPMEIIVTFTEVVGKYVRSDVRVVPIGGRLLANKNKVPEILANIRSRIIDFCFAVANDFGQVINLSNFNSEQKVNQDKIYHIMETTIHTHGDGNIINTGNASSIHATINITKGSLEELQKSFRSLGIDDDDITDITEIVQSEVPNPENKRLGNKAIDWITKITGKALKGIGSIATNVSSDILGNIISQYYGL